MKDILNRDDYMHIILTIILYNEIENKEIPYNKGLILINFTQFLSSNPSASNWNFQFSYPRPESF